jgi:TM2 domain-containing membrane protein YozV
MGWVNVFLGAVLAAEVQCKKKGGAYAQLIFLGLVGWHMFYLEKTMRGILYILSFAALMLGWFLHIPPAQYAGAGALIVFWVFDFFTLGHQVNKWNAVHAGNIIGRITSNAISKPLKEAAKEYNDVVKPYRDALKSFKRKKKDVEKLLKKLQKARSKAFSMLSRMEDILTKVPVKRIDVRDGLENMGDFSAEFNALVRGDSSMFKELDAVLASSTQEMQNVFNEAGQSIQVIEGKAGAIVAVAQTTLAAIGELAKQQEEVKKLKQKRVEALKQQKEVKDKIQQLEATEQRAARILNVITPQSKAFNHFYKKFYANVFPKGFTGQKDPAELTPEQRKMFENMFKAAKLVMTVIKQESRYDAINHTRNVKSPPPVRSLEERPVSNNSAPTGTCKDCAYYNDNWCSWNSASVSEADAACNHKENK